MRWRLLILLVADLTGNLAAVWGEIPAARFQNPAEKLPREVDALPEAYYCPWYHQQATLAICV